MTQKPDPENDQGGHADNIKELRALLQLVGHAQLHAVDLKLEHAAYLLDMVRLELDVQLSSLTSRQTGRSPANNNT